MHTLQRILGTTLLVLLVACGSGTGATGVDDVQSDSADVQIAPQDTQDAVPGTDAVLDVTDVAQPKDIWIDSDVPPIDVPPADIADIQADIAPDIAVDIGVDTGDAFVAENCNGGFGGNGMCTNGLVCWAAPCPKCGMMPQGWCLPPLENGACYDYTTCDGGACYNATPMNGGLRLVPARHRDRWPVLGQRQQPDSGLRQRQHVRRPVRLPAHGRLPNGRQTGHLHRQP